MSQETKPYRTNVHLTFPPTISGAPLVCNLTRLFDLDFNISTAQITPRQEGFLTLELSGSRDACDKGIGYLREKGVLVSPVAQRIWHNEDKCMQCGMCTALCPSSALTVDIKTPSCIRQGKVYSMRALHPYLPCRGHADGCS